MLGIELEKNSLPPKSSHPCGDVMHQMLESHLVKRQTATARLTEVR